MSQPVNFLITIANPADVPHVDAMLENMPVASRWVAVNPNSRYAGEWEIADENCWPLLQKMLEEALEQAADGDPISVAERREIIRLAVERWNFTSEAGLDQRNLTADHRADRIPHYPPREREG